MSKTNNVLTLSRIDLLGLAYAHYDPKDELYAWDIEKKINKLSGEQIKELIKILKAKGKEAKSYDRVKKLIKESA